MWNLNVFTATDSNRVRDDADRPNGSAGIGVCIEQDASQMNT